MRKLLLSGLLFLSVPVFAAEEFLKTLEVAVKQQDLNLAVTSASQLATYIRETYRLVEGGAFGAEELRLTGYSEKLYAYAQLSQKLPEETQKAQFVQLAAELRHEFRSQELSNEMESSYRLFDPARGDLALASVGLATMVLVADATGSVDLKSAMLPLLTLTPVLFPEIVGVYEWVAHQIKFRGQRSVTVREARAQERAQTEMQIPILKNEDWSACERILAPPAPQRRLRVII